MAPDVYKYKDFLAFLRDAGPRSFGRSRRTFSHSSWSRRLGYSSHRTMSMVMSGDRLPSVDMINRLSEYFRFSAKEQKYFELLVVKKRLADKKELVAKVEKQLEELKPSRTTIVVAEETWNRMCEWYFLAIKQLVGTSGFQDCASWIRKRLRNKVCNVEIRDALYIMKSLNVLVKDKDGRWRVEDQDICTTNGIPSDSIRCHHLGMLSRAKEALIEQDIDNRGYFSLTLRFDKSRLQEAKKDMTDFVKEFNEKYSSKESDHVYQLNTHLFEHTVES